MQPPCERPSVRVGHEDIREAKEANFKPILYFPHPSFDRRSIRIWSEIYYSYCDSGLFLLMRKRFLVRGLASVGWSVQPSHYLTEKERQRFRKASLNGVRMASKSAQETSRRHI